MKKMFSLEVLIYFYLFAIRSFVRSFTHSFIHSFRDRVWYAALASLELTEICLTLSSARIKEKSCWVLILPANWMLSGLQSGSPSNNEA